MYYVAVDIGCIECWEESAVLGVFTSREIAEQTCADHAMRQSQHWKGQHSFEVFEIPALDTVYEVNYK